MFPRYGPQHYEGKVNENLVKEDGRYTIKPRELNITWGKDKRFWRIPDESTVNDVELKQVGYLEVLGSVDVGKLDPGKYKLSFQLTKKPEAFGLNSVSIAATIGAIEKEHWKRVDLPDDPTKRLIPNDETVTFEVLPGCPKTDKLNFGLADYRRKWKGGLVIHEVWIQPL